MESIQNLASKKFGIMVIVIGSLLTLAIQQPAEAMKYMYMACGMSVIYSIFDIADKWLDSKKPVVK